MSAPRLSKLMVAIGLTSLACTGLATEPTEERMAIERLAKEKEAAEKAAAERAANAEAHPPKWQDDGAIAGAIGARHYLPFITSGETFAVADPAGGTITLGPPEVVLQDNGRPRVYPTGARAGHAIGKATAIEGGAEILLDYTLVWDANATAANGDKGLFEVTGFEVLDKGEGERFTFEKSGAYFSRKDAR